MFTESALAPEINRSAQTLGPRAALMEALGTSGCGIRVTDEGGGRYMNRQNRSVAPQISIC